MLRRNTVEADFSERFDRRPLRNPPTGLAAIIHTLVLDRRRQVL